MIKGSRVHFEGPDRSSRASRVIALETVMVPSGHEAVIKSGLTARNRSHSISSSVGVLTPARSFLERYGLALAKTLVDTANATVYAKVYNLGPSDVTVYKHTDMAICTPVQRIGPTLKLEDGPGDSIGVGEVVTAADGKEMPEHMIPVYQKRMYSSDRKPEGRIQKVLDY